MFARPAGRSSGPLGPRRTSEPQVALKRHTHARRPTKRLAPLRWPPEPGRLISARRGPLIAAEISFRRALVRNLVSLRRIGPRRDGRYWCQVWRIPWATCWPSAHSKAYLAPLEVTRSQPTGELIIQPDINERRRCVTLDLVNHIAGHFCGLQRGLELGISC